MLDALRQYEAAYENLDEKAVSRIYPGIDAGQLRNFFRLSRSFNLDIDYAGCRVVPSGERATATCSVTRTINPKAGAAPPPRQSEDTFHLRSTGQGWVIERVVEH